MILHETVWGLTKQTVKPDSIVLSLCDETSALSQTRSLSGVRCIFGPQGSSVQRNTAIPLARTPYVLFLDDDVELAPEYIAEMESAFERDPAIAAAIGKVVADGATSGKGIDREEALKAVENQKGCRICPTIGTDDYYGCNMFVRGDLLQKEQFDDRLPLYAWLEDRDFLWRCAKHGKIVRNQAALVAHLGTRTGRTSDVRYGYTKIANPYYLWKKSVISSLPEVIVRYWMKTTFANLIRAIVSRSPQRGDYRKRLRGNFLAYRDVMRFRLHPENVLNIPDAKGPANTPQPGEAGEAWRSVQTRST
jgi:glycosyltransferase involved in cell wall biosynthesis